MLPLDSTTDEAARCESNVEQRSFFLAVVEPVDECRTIPIGTGITIGRAEHCEVRVSSGSTSREHARVTRDGPLCVVRDLKSKNGVFVDGVRVDTGHLEHGSVLRAGGCVAVALHARPTAMEEFSEVAHGIFGGAAIREVAQRAATAAASGLNIVLEAESGSGKERFARAVHGWSKREGAFVAINCSALPEHLAEAELFGYQRGAFTGADRNQVGYFRAAAGGTLFLDELLDLPAAIQAKLLRAVERREVIPLGATTPIGVDVRIVAASQISLSQAVVEKRVRADLFARLNGVTIRIPPLRERREDIIPLFRRFLTSAARVSTPEFSAVAIERLCLHPWPLNVRELEAVANRLVVLHANAPVLGAEELSALLGPSTSPAPRTLTHSSAEDTEWQKFRTALAAKRGNVVRAAESVGISRQRAYRLLARHPEVSVSGLRRAN
jgi:transcriptional regulator with PAS, ATPase and Fis domain